jgi:hypothetical protein
MSNFCFFENGDIRFFLSDRVKELSYTVGIGNFALEGAARGFSSFDSQYEYDDYLFYAITDGVNYEVGSGQYILDGSQNALVRFPLKTSNNNQKINFSQGVKEVYVTYPATHSVYMGSGISDLNAPQKGGVSFWASPNILDYDSSLIWDKDNQRLGINNENPDYAIHIGGYGPDSIIKTSGIIIGSSGVYFPEANNEDINYIGGRQVVHFEPNELGDANIQQIIELSGVVDNILLLKQQNAGLVFAGPPSGCSPPCSPALPSFRPLILKDIEEAIDLSGILTTDIFTVSGLLYSASGVLRSDLTTVSGILDNVSGVLRSDLTTVSGILDNVSGVLRSDLTTVSGILDNVSGVLRSDLTTVSGILDNVSGVLRSDLTTVSGILDNVSGVLRSDLTTVSGVLRSDLTTASGIAQYDNQIRVTPSGLSFRLNTANQNLDPIPNVGSYISQSVEDNSIKTFGVSCGTVIQMESIQESSYSDTTAAIFAVNNMNVSGDFINSGVAYGAIVNSYRSTPIAIIDGSPLVIDGGTLKEKYGIVSNYGNWPSGYLSPKTDLAVGVSIGCLVGSGVIQSGIDLLMANNASSAHAPNTSFPNSHFGILQTSENLNYKNSLVGKTGLNTSSPAYTLDVNGSGNFSDGLFINNVDVNDKIYQTNIYDLGLISGSVDLDLDEDRMIQTAELDGTSITFVKGTGWPSSSTISKDLLLQLNVTDSTDITWSIVGSNWYKKPSSSILNSGEYIFLLRAFGNNIYGFYIGENTGSL